MGNQNQNPQKQNDGMNEQQEAQRQPQRKPDPAQKGGQVPPNQVDESRLPRR